MAFSRGVGDLFPEFHLSAVSVENQFIQLDSSSLKSKWMVLFYWPLDFTPICPTEIVEFSRMVSSFRERNTLLLGASVDSKYVHLAWKKSDSRLTHLEFDMLADNKRELIEKLGILHPTEKLALRATYIVDPNGIVRWLSVNDIEVGRNVSEVLRVLDALQTGELCPVNWAPGQVTL